VGQDQTIIQDRGLFGTKETTIDQNAYGQDTVVQQDSVFLETETLLSNKVEVALAEEASVVALVEDIGNLGKWKPQVRVERARKRLHIGV